MLYKIALFLHVSGALMLTAAMAVEWLEIINIRRAKSIERIYDSVKDYSRISILGGASMALILIPGIYMMSEAWRHNAAWIMVGFIGLILLGAIGGILTGRKFRAAKKLLSDEKYNSQELRKLSSDNSLLFSIRIRTTILVGIILLMTIKPDIEVSFIILAASILIGTIPLKVKSNAEKMKEVKHELS